MPSLPVGDHESCSRLVRARVDQLGVADGGEAVLPRVDEEHRRLDVPDRVGGSGVPGVEAGSQPRDEERAGNEDPRPGAELVVRLSSGDVAEAREGRVGDDEGDVGQLGRRLDRRGRAVRPADQPDSTSRQLGSVRQPLDREAEILPLVGAEAEEGGRALAVSARVVEEEVTASSPEDLRRRPRPRLWRRRSRGA